LCNESGKEVGLLEGTVDGDIDGLGVGIKEGICEIDTEGRLDFSKLGFEEN
jgi:hypothetical protein